MSFLLKKKAKGFGSRAKGYQSKTEKLQIENQKKLKLFTKKKERKKTTKKITATVDDSFESTLEKCFFKYQGFLLKVNIIVLTPKKICLKSKKNFKLWRKTFTKSFSTRELHFWEHCWKLFIKLRKTFARCKKQICIRKFIQYFQIVPLDNQNALLRTFAKNALWGSKSLSLKVKRNTLYSNTNSKYFSQSVPLVTYKSILRFLPERSPSQSKAFRSKSQKLQLGFRKKMFLYKKCTQMFPAHADCCSENNAENRSSKLQNVFAQGLKKFLLETFKLLWTNRRKFSQPCRIFFCLGWEGFWIKIGRKTKTLSEKKLAKRSFGHLDCSFENTAESFPLRFRMFFAESLRKLRTFSFPSKLILLRKAPMVKKMQLPKPCGCSFV